MAGTFEAAAQRHESVREPSNARQANCVVDFKSCTLLPWRISTYLGELVQTELRALVATATVSMRKASRRLLVARRSILRTVDSTESARAAT